MMTDDAEIKAAIYKIFTAGQAGTGVELTAQEVSIVGQYIGYEGMGEIIEDLWANIGATEVINLADETIEFCKANHETVSHWRTGEQT